MNSKQIFWFKRKRYGYGWVPVTWQGWMVVVGFIVSLLVASEFLLEDAEKNSFQKENIIFFLVLLVLIGILLFITNKKGPSPKWRWGSKPGDDKKIDC